ncbi:MAG: peroxidase [Gammaproteobacteria bacterium]|jgi:uncharacterized peroxidase-related enzyme|nr:peroxidase [Gammaproteobacteria bacterium]NBT44424.1 peroxidase [Gammaproteobacteria bacterium]NBY21280.1 peroxidase [Gammaproteobacteria bacterium]
MSFLLSSPGITNLPDVMNLYPGRGSLILRLIDDIMRKESQLSDGERELIFTYISGLNACQFCFHSHAPAAEALGIDASAIGNMEIDLDTQNEKLKPIFSYVKKLTQTPTHVTQDDVNAIYAAGWNEQAFMDVVGICCVVNFMNRFVNGVGIDVDANTARETGASVLPTIGYSGWAENVEKLLA